MGLGAGRIIPDRNQLALSNLEQGGSLPARDQQLLRRWRSRFFDATRPRQVQNEEVEMDRLEGSTSLFRWLQTQFDADFIARKAFSFDAPAWPASAADAEAIARAHRSARAKAFLGQTALLYVMTIAILWICLLAIFRGDALSVFLMQSTPAFRGWQVVMTIAVAAPLVWIFKPRYQPVRDPFAPLLPESLRELLARSSLHPELALLLAKIQMLRPVNSFDLEEAGRWLQERAFERDREEAANYVDRSEASARAAISRAQQRRV